ncbi:MAG TPA: ribulose-phosphate 3-epimerase [Dehalococcoidales bacterium]|nr:ribulose-phosphate 3-epimerase [Dehalococcoidales bacterium]
MSIRIVPAVLTDDPVELAKMLQYAVNYTDFVQIDIMDGQFVPSRSITWQDIQRVLPRPGWEVHLMVKSPENELANYQQAGALKAIFHYEATSQPGVVISVARKLGIKIGMAINPDTPVSAVLPLVEKLDSLLFMSVYPGYYGAKYIPEVLDKVRELNRLKPDFCLSIDGGINQNNLMEVAASGVNEICVGSGIFRQADPAEAYRNLYKLVNQ